MTRGGRNRTRDDPERRCILTGTRAPASRLLRFVVGPGDVIVPDILGRLPGRGLWLLPGPGHVAEAARRGHFARAARARVTLPPDLAEQVEAQLAARVVSLLAMARKAGDAVAGYEKTKAALAGRDVAALIQARDGSERGKSKLRAPDGTVSVGCLDAQEIGLAFGRDYVIHAALNTGGTAPRLLAEAERLAALRGLTDDTPVPAQGRPGRIARCGDT